ncbi:UNVERIFIED_CONTAM: hypothetical protein Sradi_3166600 [Sesamum radiatum]|uniref:Uncharacterized protein n=1 Tax=Sesamum radiatum TaxID=300843 RepID=A0AAW2RGG3_SESRA
MQFERKPSSSISSHQRPPTHTGDVVFRTFSRVPNTSEPRAALRERQFKSQSGNQMDGEGSMGEEMESTPPTLNCGGLDWDVDMIGVEELNATKEVHYVQ